MMDRDRGCLLTACRSFPNQLEQLQKEKKNRLKINKTDFHPLQSLPLPGLALETGFLERKKKDFRLHKGILIEVMDEFKKEKGLK